MPPVNLPDATHIAVDTDTLFDDLASALVGAAVQAVQQRGVFHLALSGGSTPEPFYMRLVTDPRYRALPWEQTHLWIVDERRVPPDDEQSNFKMIRETLADHVPVRRRRLHPMPVLADDPAGEYEAELRDAFENPDGTPRLDFVLLGMGGDAHTASLFPGSGALGVKDRLVAVNDGPKVTPPPRVTMTYPLLNAARELAVLLTGAKKADALRRVELQLRGGNPDVASFPITGIEPEDGELVWYLDGAAAGAD